jgi:hypothetical protein
MIPRRPTPSISPALAALLSPRRQPDQGKQLNSMRCNKGGGLRVFSAQLSSFSVVRVALEEPFPREHGTCVLLLSEPVAAGLPNLYPLGGQALVE